MTYFDAKYWAFWLQMHVSTHNARTRACAVSLVSNWKQVVIEDKREGQDMSKHM